MKETVNSIQASLITSVSLIQGKTIKQTPRVCQKENVAQNFQICKLPQSLTSKSIRLKLNYFQESPLCQC